MGQIPLIEPKEEVSEKTGQTKTKKKKKEEEEVRVLGKKKKQGNDFFSFLVSATESLCLTVNYLLY
jgi:hypothetical protein